MRIVSECQNEYQMCVTCDDTKNGRKMNQDQFGVTESKRVSNWCQSVGNLFVSEMGEHIR